MLKHLLCFIEFGREVFINFCSVSLSSVVVSGSCLIPVYVTPLARAHFDQLNEIVSKI